MHTRLLMFRLCSSAIPSSLSLARSLLQRRHACAPCPLMQLDPFLGRLRACGALYYTYSAGHIPSLVVYVASPHIITLPADPPLPHSEWRGRRVATCSVRYHHGHTPSGDAGRGIYMEHRCDSRWWIGRRSASNANNEFRSLMLYNTDVRRGADVGRGVMFGLGEGLWGNSSYNFGRKVLI